ncbi:MAG: DUF29 domain-containing protein [Thermosynechococcaceae cyanobacterium]
MTSTPIPTPAISKTGRQTSHADLYETDFVEWIEQATDLLKQGKFNELDIENLIEEVGDLGRRDRRALCSNLEIVLLHLLKWEFQSEQRSNSWRGSIREHRRRIARICKDSPSLNNYLKQEYLDCYAEARLQAADETGLSLETFPVKCPYTVEQVLHSEFLPAA